MTFAPDPVYDAALQIAGWSIQATVQGAVTGCQLTRPQMSGLTGAQQVVVLEGGITLDSRPGSSAYITP